MKLSQAAFTVGLNYKENSKGKCANEAARLINSPETIKLGHEIGKYRRNPKTKRKIRK